MNTPIFEVEIINPDMNLEIKLTEDETILEIKETIMNLYDYKSVKNFELYLEGFHLNEFYDYFNLKFFLDIFLIRRLHVLKKSEIQLFEVKKNELQQNLFRLNDELSLQSDCEAGFRQSLEEMKLLELNLKSYLIELDDKLKLDETHKSTMTGISHSYISDQIEHYENIKKSKETILEAKMHQLFLCKKKEQKANQLGRKNKEIVSELKLLETTLKVMKEKMNNLKDKENSIRRQKQTEAKMINSYITNKRKVTSLECIKLRFSKLYKYALMLKLLNEKTVLVYHKQSEQEENKEGRLEIRQIVDDSTFSEIYLQQNKRDEFFLNHKEKLFIAVKNYVFLYEYKSNKIFELPPMTEDHKGGSFIYVPGNNSVYCISGLISILTEKLSLDNLDQYLLNKDNLKLSDWKTVTKLKSPRSYYSVCVIDSCIIFILLGFDLWKGEFLSSVEKFDTSKSDEGWTTIKIFSEKPIKLTFSGVIVTSDEECYILGGKDEHNNDNTFIYVLDITQGIIEDSEMRLPIPPGMEIYHVENKNLFYQETSFLPLQANSNNNNINNMFYLCCFDSKNFVHRVNIKTFDYSYIHQEIDLGNEFDESHSISQGSQNQDPEIDKLNNK